jgi:hypothetical protein
MAKRRRNRIQISENKLFIQADDDLQADLDAIPSTMPGLKNLRIVNVPWDKNFYGFELAVPMPQLEEVEIADVGFKTFTLTPSIAPNLKRLSMESCFDPDSNVTVQLPNLSNLCIENCKLSDKDGWFYEMLANANKLRTLCFGSPRNRGRSEDDHGQQRTEPRSYP